MSARSKADYNMFLSWSGIRSRWIAETFREWLPVTLQASKPWLSAKDIDKGTRSLQEIAKALESVKFGISFLTPENLNEPWILYEAGALTKNIDDTSRLYTFLLGGLQPQDVKPPLGILQHTKPTEADTLTLIKSINLAVSENPLSEEQVERIFEPFWVQLKKKLKNMPAPEQTVSTKRSLEDMVAEILETVRSEKAVTTNFVLPTTGYTYLSGGDNYTLGSIGTWTPAGNSLVPSLAKKTFFVKVRGKPTVETVEGNYATEEPRGTLIVFDSSGVTVRRFDKNVERWWKAD